MLDLSPLLEQLTIKPKDLSPRRFNLDYIDPDYGDLGWAQRPFIKAVESQYNSGLPVRVIVLKARQLGISTVTAAVMFWWAFMHQGTSGLVMAHEKDPTTELFEITKRYWEEWPYRRLYTLKYATKQQLHWLETGSKLRVATAKNVGGGRSSTLHAVHASEVAFYQDPETLMTGLLQAIPNRHGTMVVMESTANGIGNYFYEQWQQSVEGKTEYLPLFFPWFGHSEYRLSHRLKLTDLDQDERDLFKAMITDPVYKLSSLDAMRAIAWRRWAIPNRAHGDPDYFMQEYPSTPEEAFIVSGRPIFGYKFLKNCFDEQAGHRGFLMGDVYSRPQFILDNRNPHENTLTIFKAPRRGDSRNDRYFVAGDPSESIAGDPACIQVINRQTFEQVAVWHGRIEPLQFADEMMKIGRFYNNAMLCPEIEGGGQAVIGAIIKSNYPNIWADKRPDRVKGSFNVFGWWTNYQRKMWAIGNLQSMFVDGSILIHDRVTFNQLINFVQRDNGEYGNSDPMVHDDSVMSLAIAITGSTVEGPFLADTDGRNLIVDMYNQETTDEADLYDTA